MHHGPVGQILSGLTSGDKIYSVEHKMVLIPNQNGKFLAWGYPDGCVRMGSCDNPDKLTCVFEPGSAGYDAQGTGHYSGLAPDISVATMPTERLLFTGGFLGTLVAWTFNPSPTDDSKTYMKIEKQLYGHDDLITCIASSATYRIVVTGSRDHTCIIWDINKLGMMNQLPKHPHPISCCHVNNLTGDIITSCGWHLFVWTINGEPMAHVNTAVYQYSASSGVFPSLYPAQNASSGVIGPSPAGITCLCSSEVNEWDKENVILTGSTDGVVRMWSVSMLRLKKSSVSEATDQNQGGSGSSPKQQSPGMGMGGGSASAQVVHFPPPTPLAQNNFSHFSLESLEEEALDEVSNISFAINHNPVDRTLSAEQVDSARNSMLSQGTDDGTPSLPEGMMLPHLGLGSTSGQRPSSASTYLHTLSSPSGGDHDESAPVFADDPSDSFLMVSQADIAMRTGGGDHVNQEGSTNSDASARNEAGAGAAGDEYVWQYALLFRSKLTTHTAFERPDNPHPAPVTAIALNTDHSKIYVGDGRGRVFSWSVSEAAPGHTPVDHWMRDEGSDACMAPTCTTRFSFTERRHHCRNCGKLFCSRCSNYQCNIPMKKINMNVRVCRHCYLTLTAPNNSSSTNN